MELLRGRPPFKEHEEKLFRDREVYVQALNSVLVGAALIGSVSFAGWLQLPSQTAFQTAQMKVFWVSNGVSFYSAVAAMCVAIAALLPTPNMYVVGIVNQLKLKLLLAVFFLAVSLVGVVMAFAGAGFAAAGAASSPDSDCADDSYGRRHRSPSPRECESIYRNLMSGTTVPGVIFIVGPLLAFIMCRSLVDVLVYVLTVVTMWWRLRFVATTHAPLRVRARWWTRRSVTPQQHLRQHQPVDARLERPRREVGDAKLDGPPCQVLFRDLANEKQGSTQEDPSSAGRDEELVTRMLTW
mgnify:FL=1